MDFVCKVTFKNALSEIFDFEWSIDTHFNSTKIASRTFHSTLHGGLSFQILVSKSENSRSSYYVNAVRTSMCVGLRKIDEKNCDIKALLIFEIRNNAGQLYLKESLEKLFSQSNEEHFSDFFDSPTSNREVRGRKGNIYFDGNRIRIKGKIFFLCCQENKSPEALCKNIVQLQANLKDLLQDKVYADVQFHIESAVIHAHKNILSSRSAVFKKMFEQNMKEKEANIVKITDIEKSVFEVFLTFLYTGSIQDKQLNLIMPLYSVADKYAVETLLKTCSNILVNYISDTTVAPILKLADMHNDGNLKATAIDFICKNFAKVESTESWDILLNSDPRLASYALKQVSVTAAKNTSVKSNSITTDKVTKAKSVYRDYYYDDAIMDDLLP